MLRRNARLRREYLYRKNLAGKEAEVYEKKKRMRKALDEGLPIPTEELSSAHELQRQIDLDDARTQDAAADPSNLDDEYAYAGVKDPKVLLTTSRQPSSRLAQFAKEMRLCFPNCYRMNRGNTVIGEVVNTARRNDVTDIVILHETRGEPDGMIVSHLPHGPTAFFGLSNCILRHDLPEKPGAMSEAYPHLVFDNMETKLGHRVRDILKYLFPVPKPDSRRVMTFANRHDIISFRHHVYRKLGHQEIDLQECGPRFDMKVYQIRLGTLEMNHAENEWVLRPYMNTAKRRRLLSKTPNPDEKDDDDEA